MVKKTYRPPSEASPRTDPAFADLVTVAEFGTRLEADTVAALARQGGFDVTVRGLTPFVVLAAEAPHGAHLVLAPRVDAVEVRRYLDQSGAHIIDDTPAAQLNWKGAAIVTAGILVLLTLAAVGILLKGA